MVEGHYSEVFASRHFPTVVELWCPNVDEGKIVRGKRYVRYCPMCGESIDLGYEVYDD